MTMAVSSSTATRQFWRAENILQIALLILSIAIVTIGRGAFLNILFTPLATLIGLYIYVKSPSRAYISFCYWLWIFTPLVRRLADWQSSFQAISLIMLAPVLVNSISLLTLFRANNFPQASILQSFRLLIAICCYGALLGLLYGSTFATAFGLLNWLMPLAMGIHILVYWQDAEEVAKSIFQTMAWGSLVMGIYGIVQYFQPQPWDVYWVNAAQMASIGQPEPQKLRLFSTMNSPGPFAVFLSAGLLMLLSSVAKKIRWLAAAPALTAFMLTLVRSAWGGFAIGLVVMISFAKGRTKVRYLTAVAVLVILAIPLLTVGPIAESVQRRMDTISNLEEDNSFQTRMEIYNISGEVSGLIVGHGIGSTGLSTKLSTDNGELSETGNFDSGVLNLFFVFGWAGIFFVIAFILVYYYAAIFASTNEYSQIAFAIFVGISAQNIFANVFTGNQGMLVFPLAALAISQGIEKRFSKMKKNL